MVITIYFWIFIFLVIENSVSATKKGSKHVVNETRNEVGEDIQLPHSLYEKVQEEEARRKNKYKTTQKTTEVHHLDIDTTTDYSSSSPTTEQGQIAAAEEETQTDKAVHTQNVTESNQKLPDETHAETEEPAKTNLNPIVTDRPQKRSIRRKRTQYPKNERISRLHKNAKRSDIQPIRRSHYSFGQKRKVHNNNNNHKNSKRTNLSQYSPHNAGKPTKRKLDSNVSPNTNLHRKRVRNRDGTKRSNRRNSRGKNAFGFRSQSRKSNSSSIVNLKATGKSERVDNAKNQTTLNLRENRTNQNDDGKQNNNTDHQISNTKNIPSFRTGGNKSNKKKHTKNKKKLNTRFKHTGIYGKRNGLHLRMFENKIKNNKISRRKFYGKNTLSRNDDNYSLKEGATKNLGKMNQNTTQYESKNDSNNISGRKSGKMAPHNFRTRSGSKSKLVAKHIEDLEQRNNDSNSKSTTESTLNSRVGKDNAVHKHTSSRTNLVPSAKSHSVSSKTITDKKYLSRKLKKKKLKLVTEQLQNKISSSGIKTGKRNSVKTKNRGNERKGEHGDNIRRRKYDGNIDGNNLAVQNMKNQSKQKLDTKRSEIAYGSNNSTQTKNFGNKNQTYDVNIRKSSGVSAPSVRLDNGPKKKEGNREKLKSASFRRNLILSNKKGSVDGKKYERSKNKAPRRNLQNRFNTSNRKTGKRNLAKQKSSRYQRRRLRNNKTSRRKSNKYSIPTFRTDHKHLERKQNSKNETKQKLNTGRSETGKTYDSSNSTHTKVFRNKDQSNDVSYRESDGVSTPSVKLRNSRLENDTKSKNGNHDKKYQRPDNKMPKKHLQNRVNISNIKTDNHDSKEKKSSKEHSKESTPLKSNSNTKVTFRTDDNSLAKKQNSKTQSRQTQDTGRSETTEGHGSINSTQTKRNGNKNQTDNANRQKSNEVSAPAIVLRNRRLDNSPKGKKVNDNKKHQGPQNEALKKRPQNRLNTSNLKTANRDSGKSKSSINKTRNMHSNKTSLRKSDSNAKLAFRNDNNNLAKEQNSKTQNKQKQNTGRSETTEAHGSSNNIESKRHDNKSQTNDVNSPKSKGVIAPGVVLRNSRLDNSPKAKTVDVNKKFQRPENKALKKHIQNRLNSSSLKSGNRDSETKKSNIKSKKAHSDKSIRRKFGSNTELTVRTNDKNLVKKQNSKTKKTHGLSNRIRTKNYGNKHQTNDVNRSKSNSVGALSVKLRNRQLDNGPKGKTANVKKYKHPKNKIADKQLKKRLNTSNLKAGNRNSMKTQKNRNKTRKGHRKSDSKTKLTFRTGANNLAKKQNSENRSKQKLDTKRPETLKARGLSKKLPPFKSNNSVGKKTFLDKEKKRLRNEVRQKYLRNRLNASDLKIGVRDLEKKKSSGNLTREAYINNYGLNLRFGHNWLDNNGQDVINKSKQHKNISSGRKSFPSNTNNAIARKIFDARQYYNVRTPTNRIHKKVNTSSGRNSHKILRDDIKKRIYNAKYDGHERNEPISTVKDQHDVTEKSPSVADSKQGIGNNITEYLLKRSRDWQLKSTPAVYRSEVVHPKQAERKYNSSASEHFGPVVKNGIVNTKPSTVLEGGSSVGNNSAIFDGHNASYDQNRNVSRATNTDSLSTKAIENTTTEKSNDLEPNKPSIVNFENGTEYSITNVTRTKYSPNGVQLGEFNETIVKTVYKTYSIMKVSSEGGNVHKELLQKIIGK